MGLDKNLHKCVLDHVRDNILWEFHARVLGGHVGGNATSRKVLQVGLWWPTLFKDAKHYLNMLKNMLRSLISTKIWLAISTG